MEISSSLFIGDSLKGKQMLSTRIKFFPVRIHPWRNNSATIEVIWFCWSFLPSKNGTHKTMHLKTFRYTTILQWEPTFTLMDDLRFYILLSSISVISGQWADDNKRLCAMEPLLRLGRFCLEQGSNSWLLDQYASTELPGLPTFTTPGWW